MTRLRETTNEYGTPVVEYRCETCGDLFTVCPAPHQVEDLNWTGCQAEQCASYDPARDADKWFDNGRLRVRPVREGDGSSGFVVTPFFVLDGGKSDPSDCPLCDGHGRCWNNADPTSGQFVACSCERGTDDPPGV